jgi:5-dehydro-4-deoxyglucarate dehydratase
MEIKRQAPTGILGFPIVPFDEAGKVDEKALVRNIEFLLDGGLTSIFVACGAGEYQSLNKAEYHRIVEIAVDTINHKVPVYTGVGGNITTAVELAQLSQDLGADGYLILPPYLINGEQEGLFQYFKTIIQSTELNAIIYQRDNAIMSVETVKRLIEFPQVVGFKDGDGNIDTNVELVQSIGNRLTWINGMPLAEVTMPAYIPLGYEAYSSAISNYIPHISRLFYQALLDNNQQLTNELLQNVILPINHIRKQKKGYAVSLIKAGMEIVGLPVRNIVRPPVAAVEKEHYQQLEKIIKVALEHYPKDITVNK